MKIYRWKKTDKHTYKHVSSLGKVDIIIGKYEGRGGKWSWTCTPPLHHTFGEADTLNQAKNDSVRELNETLSTWKYWK